MKKEQPENHWEKSLIEIPKRSHVLRQIVQAGHHLSLRGWEGKRKRQREKTVHVLSSWKETEGKNRKKSR